MDVKHRIVQLLRVVLRRIGPQLLVIFINRLRDHIKMHPLGGLRLEVHEIRQAFRACIGQPIINRHAIARRLGNLVALVIKEQFIAEMLRFFAAKNFANAVIDRRVGRMVFAIHFKINAKRGPARAKIWLPLQLYAASRHRHGPLLAGLVVKRHSARFGVHMLHRHIHHATRFRVHWQENRIGLAAFFTQRF